MTKKRIFITGGTGFVGKNLQEYLSKEYIIFAPTHHQLNMEDCDSVKKFVINNKINTIIHAASIGGGRDTVDLADVVQANLRMFFNVALCSPYVEKIIQFGSGAEYDKSEDIRTVKETDFDKRVPKDDYGFYKYVCSKYAETSDKIVCLRLFGVYGKYENYLFKFISNAIVKNLLGMPIAIGQNVYFDYLYIDDLMRIVAHVLTHKMKYASYNVAMGKRVDLVSLVGMINNVSVKPSTVTITNKGLNREYTADNTRLKNELQSFVFTPHQQAIGQLYQWYKDNIHKLDTTSIRKDPYFKHIKIKK